MNARDLYIEFKQAGAPPRPALQTALRLARQWSGWTVTRPPITLSPGLSLVRLSHPAAPQSTYEELVFWEEPR